jgi:transketolase C-terminal domain/subunit
VQPRRFKRIGIADKFVSTVGDQTYLRKEIGLSRDAIAAAVRSTLQQ